MVNKRCLALVATTMAISANPGLCLAIESSILTPRNSTLVPRTSDFLFDGNQRVSGPAPHAYEITIDGSHICASEPLRGVTSKDGHIENVDAGQYLQELQGTDDATRLNMALQNLQGPNFKRGDFFNCHGPGTGSLPDRTLNSGPSNSQLLELITNKGPKVTIVKTTASVFGGFALALGLQVARSVDTHSKIPTNGVLFAAALILTQILSHGIARLRGTKTLTPLDALVYTWFGLIADQAIALWGPQEAQDTCPTIDDVRDGINLIPLFDQVKQGTISQDAMEQILLQMINSAKEEETKKKIADAMGAAILATSELPQPPQCAARGSGGLG